MSLSGDHSHCPFSPSCLQLAYSECSGRMLPACRVTVVFFVFLHRKRGIEVVQVSTDHALTARQAQGFGPPLLSPSSTRLVFNFSPWTLTVSPWQGTVGAGGLSGLWSCWGFVCGRSRLGDT